MGYFVKSLVLIVLGHFSLFAKKRDALPDSAIAPVVPTWPLSRPTFQATTCPLNKGRGLTSPLRFASSPPPLAAGAYPLKPRKAVALLFKRKTLKVGRKIYTQRTRFFGGRLEDPHADRWA
jgi:hypothetical protein